MPSINRTKTYVYEITSVGLDMVVFDEAYKRIRGNMRYKGFQCFNCNHKFELGDKISLIAIKGKTNKVVCHDCAVKLSKKLKEELNNE